MSNQPSRSHRRASKTQAPTEPKRSSQQQWWDNGIRFECQGSGNCCVSRGQYGFVYLTPDDRRQMAKVLNMTTSAFTRRYCVKTDGVWRLKDGDSPDCLFLRNGNRCSVYEGRPQQCRTWPFWPEVMNAKTWQKEVASFCPGVGKGRRFTREEIRTILESQETWLDDLARR